MLRGSTGAMAANALLYLLLIGVPASLGLMGEQWLRFFIVTLAAAFPIAAAVVAAGSWANRSTPDDDHAVFRKPGGTRIPYGRIRSVLVMERGRTLDVYVKVGTFRTVTLVRMLPAGDRARLLEGIARRLPGVPVRTRRWHRLATAAFVLAAVIAGFAAAHAFLYERNPVLRVTPVALEGPAPTAAEKKSRTGRADKRMASPRARIGAFRFTVPAGFEFLGERDGALSFFDARRRMRLEAVANVRHEELELHAAWFRYGMGVNDYAGLSTLIVRARYGLIPLYLRSISLFRLEDVALYESVPPLPRSIITQGRRGAQEQTHLLVPGTQTGSELHLFVSGPSRMTVEELRALVAGVQTAVAVNGTTQPGKRRDEV